jgi:DNA-binding helix-hairpin-helix protein with protein kinase domain
MNKADNHTRQVTDSLGHTYHLTDKLGQGGQGSVWRTDQPQVLIKQLSTRTDEQRQRWMEQLSWLMRQDLDGLHLAKPLALLKAPEAGYVMELMDGLSALTGMLEQVKDEGVEGFLHSGGLARRLALLKQLATTLALLHARGMMFGDLSPDNIYVSSKVEHAELWLIDCDNISVETSPCRALYTPDYGAPELIAGQADFSTRTDVWSFAVIAFQLLTGNHPFKGDFVNDGEPDLEEQALAGKLPWIGHSSDPLNTSSRGIPLSLTTTGKLALLFSRCFEAGLADPLARPSMAQWLEAIVEAAERTIHCSECASTYLLNPAKTCPFCDHVLEPDHVLFSEFQFLPPEHLPDWHQPSPADSWLKTGRVMLLQAGRVLALRRSIPSMWTSETQTPLTTVTLTDGKLTFTPLDVPLTLQRATQVVQLAKPVALERQPGPPYVLHVGKLDEPHMAWRFTW